MRASVASISKKIISTFFAAALALGLVPAAAFAETSPAAPATENSESASADSDIAQKRKASAYEDQAASEPFEGGEDAQQAISSEGDETSPADVISSEASEAGGVEQSRPSNEGDDSNSAIPAGGIINQEVALDTVAQAESTRSFFLAQTLESTKTVPMVSAKLPIDTNATESSDPSQVASTEDSDSDPSQHVISTEPSDSEASGETSAEDNEDSEPTIPAISAESTVIGSFTYLGMTFAIEPGGESVVLMAVDYSKLPEEYIQKQVLVIPDTATPDGIDYYSVTRIADDAFAGLTKDNANPDYTGCGALFSDEELLAEAGIDSSEVQEFLSEPATTDVAEGGESAGADSQDMPKDKPWAYEDQDQATSEPAIISSVVDLNDGDASANVISSGVSGANGVEKSRPSSEGEGESAIRTIVSMEGNTATLDDGSTYEFKNPLAGCAGILALGIPVSVTTIEDDAFSGFDTLQYVVVSEDNPNYSMYDGCLYTADQSSLLLIPEGRLGAVRIAPSVTSIDPEVFSHCPSVDALVADADSAAYQLLSENGESYKNANDDQIELVVSGDAKSNSAWEADSELIMKRIAQLSEMKGSSEQRNSTFPTVSSAQTERLARGVTVNNTGAMVGTVHYLQSEHFVCINDDGYRDGMAKDDASQGYTLRFYGAGGSTYRYRFHTLYTDGATMHYLYDCLDVPQYNSHHTITLGHRTGPQTLDIIDSLYFTNSSNPLPTEFRRDSGTKRFGDSTGKWTFWFNDYSYNQPIGVSFISEYYTGQAGRASKTYSQGAWGDGENRETKKTQMSAGSDGNPIKAGAVASEDKKMEISYPEAPKATNGEYVFKGWRTSPNLDEDGEWYYLANGFRGSDYVQKDHAYKFVTLYAIYEQGYPVTLDDVRTTTEAGEGGFAALNEELKVKAQVKVPKTDGYAFNGYYELREDGTRNYWYDPSGKLVGSADGGFSDDSYGYPLESDYTLYADWVRDVELDIQDGTANDKVHVTWAEDLPSEAIADGACDSATGPAAHTSKPIPVPMRAGYEFAGYWSTPYDESDPGSDLYYEAVGSGSGRAVQPVASKTWDIDQDRLYAHWKYRIELDPNVVNSDDEDALGDSAIAFDMSGYAGGTDGVYSDDYGNAYAVTRSGDDETVSIEAIYGSPIKLPTVKGRTGYDDTQTWGVAKTEKGVAEGTLSLAEGYTANGSDRSDIAQAPLSYHATDASDRPTFMGPSDYARGITLYADWSGKAKYYDVTLRSAYSGDGYVYLSDADATIRARYDSPLLIGEGDITPSIQTPAYGDGSEPTNLVFLGFATEPNAPYTARSGIPYQGIRYIMASDDAVRTPVSAADPSANGLADFREASSIVLYALWGYPEVSIDFDLQSSELDGIVLKLTDGASASAPAKDAPVQGGGFSYDLVTKDALPGFGATSDGRTTVERIAQSRPGFMFNGFWTHPYKEASDDTAQYYAADGTCLYGDGTWDKTQGATLYAHWRYDVFLEANAYNSSNEVVLNPEKTDYAVNIAWTSADGTFVTEQKDYATDATHAVVAKVEQADGSVGTDEALNLKRYRFTAIDGAPIQLPQVSDRRGYTGTRAWGTTPGAKGASSGIVSYADDAQNVTAPFRPELVVVSDGTLGADGKRYACVLYADWSGSDAKSGKARTYAVKLLSTYDRADGTDGFEVADSALASQSVTVTYDQPIDTREFKEYATGDTGNYVDATKDAAGSSRNLVLKGFYRDKCAASGPDVGGSANRVYVDVAADESGEAFSTAGLPFREVYADGATEIPLYAFWAYNVTDIAFDLQGGTIDGKGADALGASALKIEGVTSHDPTPSLSGHETLKTVPARAGYVFAGWWNTPYNEGSTETVDSVEVTPRKYYGESLSIPEDSRVWLEFGDTTLYAHWRYTIQFEPNLDDVNDIADVALSAVKGTNDEVRTSDTVPLSRAGGDGPVYTDPYGNRYYETTSAKDGYGESGVYTGLRVEAIAGAPVKLPSAQLRRTQNVTTKTYDRVGYDATWEWSHGSTDPDALDYGKVEGNERYFTMLNDSWTAGYGVAGSVPCKVGGHTNDAELRLFAQWDGAKKDYDVEVLYSYDQTRDDGTTTGYAVKDGHAASRTFNVTYDEADFTVVDGGTSFATDADGAATCDLAPADSTAAHALATNSGLEYDGLDFVGITTVGISYQGDDKVERTNDFLDSADNESYPSYGTRYWDASGKLVQTRFRAITGPDVDVYNTCRDDDANYKPYRMYVAWAQPTREVTFNLFDEPSAEDATGITELSDGAGGTAAFTLQKGGSTTAEAGSLHEMQLADLASKVIEYQNESNYVFGGFWSAPQNVTGGDGATYTYEPYEEDAKHEARYAADTPTCYYVLQGDALVPAEPTTDAAGAADGWLTADNTSGVWLEDGDTTLYAHWKYDLTLSVDDDDTIPVADGPSDMIAFGASSSFNSDNAKASVAFADFDKSAQTDERGMLTYGAPLTIPMDGGSQDNAIARVRDFASDAARSYGFGDSGYGRTGYTFAGWTRDPGRDAEDAGLYTYAKAQANPLRTSEFAPGAGDGERGHVTLYAQWSAKQYQVELQHYPAMYADYITSASVRVPEDNRAQTINVRYDETFGQALSRAGETLGRITPPSLYGFTYLGYYATDKGRVDSAGVSDAGVQYFGPAISADANAPEFTGRAVATDAPWFQPVTGNQSNANIYAYYERDAYTMTFDKLDENDGTLQKLTGVSGNLTQTWHYNDKLWKDSTDAVKTDAIDWASTLPSTSSGVYSRHGYTFEGWYILPDPEGGWESLSPEEQRAYRADKENRIYLYRITGYGIDGEPEATGVSTVQLSERVREDGTVETVETWTSYPDILTWSTPLHQGIAYDAERSYTLYAGWKPKEYTVTFDYNLQNGSDAGLKLTRTYRYEEEIATPNPTDAGAPFTFKGWNEKEGYASSPSTWLLDKSTYDPAVDRDETNGASGYPVMMPPTGSKPVSGRFMPYNEGSEIYLYGAWEEPTPKKVVMFSGSHGSLQGGTAGQDGYKSVSHNFKAGWHIDNPSGLEDYSPAIKLSVDPGYEFVGWVELSPSDITGDPDAKRYADIDWGAVDPDTIKGSVNTSDYTPKTTSFFPPHSKVTGTAAKGYVNPYTLERGVSYRDVYLVAAYTKIDYTLKLDLGPAATYGYEGGLGAKLDPSSPGGFNQPDPNAANILYQRSFSMETQGDIIVPDAVSANHRFLGWKLPDGTLLHEAGLDWYDVGTKRIDPAKFADYLKAGRTQTFTLSAAWEDRIYTIEFLSDHPDPAVASGSEDIRLEGLSLDDEFTLPYPATRGGGSFFDYWSLLSASDEDPYIGRFYGGDRIALKDLLKAIAEDGSFNDHSAEGSVHVGDAKVEDDTVSFEARWRDAISVTVPVQVCVKVDPSSKVVLTADNLEISANYESDSAARTPVRVVSLRYDRIAADDGGYVFGTERGKAYLSVYPDLETVGDTSHLFEADNVLPDGRLKTGVKQSAEEQKPPLLIDLAASAVFSDGYPTATGGAWNGLDESEATHDAVESDSGHGLSSHGFRPFGANDEATATLPIRYGLLFSDFDGLMGYAPKLGDLASDTDESFPIAKLYYTIGLVPLP